VGEVECQAPALGANGGQAHRRQGNPRASRPIGPGRRRRRFQPNLDPLPVGVLAVGGAELMASIQLARAAWPLGGPARDAACARVVHAAALVVSAQRAGARVPLISSVILLRVLGLLTQLAGDGFTKRSGWRPAVTPVLWLFALAHLRREAARAEAWNSPRRGRTPWSRPD
jgi:hypothetical protein